MANEDEPVVTEGEAPQVPDPADVPLPDAMLHRSLAEVYLLLDNLATNNGKTLPRTLDSPLFLGGKAPTDPDAGADWLQQITAINWPPEGTRRDMAADAARLIHAKDQLSRQVWPATSLSIAFTSLVIENEFPYAELPKRLWRGLTGWFTRDSAPPPAQPRLPGDPLHDITIGQLAAVAFPNLVGVAGIFRAQRMLMIWVLVLWLCLTSWLAWDVATGNALLARVTTLEQQRHDLVVQTASPPAAAPTPESSGTPSTPAPAAKPKASASSEALRETTIDLCVASRNLGGWMDRRVWNNFPYTAWMPLLHAPARSLRLPNRLEGRKDMPCTADPAKLDVPDPYPVGTVNWQWAAVLLAVLANTVLPVFYGVLGAAASVVRNMSADIRDWLLTPRRMRQAWIKLALGAVIGGTISLFFSPTGDGQTIEKLTDQIHIGAAALCFLAGYGVEGVFEFLDSLVARIFNLGPAQSGGHQA